MDEFYAQGLAIEDTSAPPRPSTCWRSSAALMAQHGTPGHLRSDNGPEFVAHAVEDWLAHCRVETLNIEPGKPWQNGKEERFDGTVRDECLTLQLFHVASRSARPARRVSRSLTIRSGHRPAWVSDPRSVQGCVGPSRGAIQDPHIAT